MGKTYVMVMETKTRKWISPLEADSPVMDIQLEVDSLRHSAGVIDVYVACDDDV